MIIEVFLPLVVGALKPSITFRSLGSLPSSLQLAPTLPHSPLHPTGGGDPNTYMAIGRELGASWSEGSELGARGASWERAGARGASWERAGASWEQAGVRGASWSEGSELEQAGSELE